MTKISLYHRLLYEAAESSHKLDRFDLHSEDPASVEQWNVLLDRSRQAHLALIHYCRKHEQALMSEIKDVTEQFTFFRTGPPP